MTKTYNNEELIKLAKNGDKDAEEKLLLENESLCHYIAKRFDNTGIDKEDLASVAKIGLLKAYKSFDLSRNIKFATYASRIMQNEILMLLRNNKKHKNNISLETPIAHDNDGNNITLVEIIPMEEPQFNFEDYDMLNKVLQEFYKTEKEIDIQVLEKCTMNGRTQRDVAEELGLSQSYVSRIESKVKIKFKSIALKHLGIKEPVVKLVEKHGNTKYNKEEFLYIFENYAFLKSTEIAEIIGCSKRIVTKTRTEYKDGLLFNIEPKINLELSKKINDYIRESKNKNFKSEKKVVNQ
jgi:RNA polymerase sporulation-specific sigma factor